MRGLFSLSTFHVALAAFCGGSTILPAFAETAYERTVQRRDSSVSIELASLPYDSTSTLPQLMNMVPDANIYDGLEDLLAEFINTASLSTFPGNATTTDPSCLTSVIYSSGLILKLCSSLINDTAQFTEWITAANDDVEDSVSYMTGTISGALQNLEVTELCASPALTGDSPWAIMTVQLGGYPNGPSVDGQADVIQKLAECATASPLYGNSS